MVTATRNTVTHPNCDAQEAAGVILANVKGATPDDAVNALARAERTGNAPLSRGMVLHTGYARNADHYDASTALYRVTLGRVS